jgi:hemerythrin-like metal-binding protein
MISIEWKKSYDTGIALLDTQNKHFIEKINLLFELQDNNPEPGFLCEAFCSTLEYAREHFRQEEIFLERLNPDGLFEHCQQHYLFQQNLYNSFKESIKGGKKAICELNQFIRDWIDFHITHLDQNIAMHVRNLAHH